MLITCNIIFLLCFLIFFSVSGCSREPPETDDLSRFPTQLGEVKNGYQVIWRIVVTPGKAAHNTHWEDAKTLCIFIAEYVPIDALRVKGDGVEIPLSVMKNENTPSAQYLFFKEGVMLRVKFDKKIPARVEIISIGKIL